MNTAERRVQLMSLRSLLPSLVALFLLALCFSESHSASVSLGLAARQWLTKVPMTLPGQQPGRGITAPPRYPPTVLDPVTATEKTNLAAPRGASR